MRATRWAGAMAGALLLVGVLGAAQALSGPSVPTVEQLASDAGISPLTLDEARAVDARLLAVNRAIHGTVDQRRALDFLANHWVGLRVEHCMVRRGQHYFNPFNDRLYGSQDASNDRTWTAPLLDESTLHNVMSDAAADRRQGRANDTLTAQDLAPGTPYEDAFHDCQDLIGGRPHLGSRAGERTADKALNAVLGEAQAAVGDVEAYDHCMSLWGIDTTYEWADLHGYPGLLHSLDHLRPESGDVPAEGQAPGDAWTEFADTYHRAMGIDAACRLPGYLVAMAVLEPALDDFERDQRTAVEAASRWWQRTAADAARLGFVADRPPRFADAAVD